MKLFSSFTKVIEIIPPSGKDMNSFFKSIKVLKETGVKVVSVVSNPMAQPKLPALYIAQYLISEGFKTIVHYPLSGRSEVIVKSDMLQAVSMGVDVMLILSGDPHGITFESGMNILDAIKFVRSHNILVGVAANPNKINHEHLKAKVDAGANYFQTQPVFTIDCALKFLKEIEQYNLPVLIGIVVPKSKKHLERLLQIPGVVIPKEYLKSFEQINTEEDFMTNAFARANKIIETIKEMTAGVYLSMPQSMFRYIGEKI